jgi:hypothetical protein
LIVVYRDYPGTIVLNQPKYDGVLVGFTGLDEETNAPSARHFVQRSSGDVTALLLKPRTRDSDPKSIYHCLQWPEFLGDQEGKKPFMQRQLKVAIPLFRISMGVDVVALAPEAEFFSFGAARAAAVPVGAFLGSVYAALTTAEPDALEEDLREVVIPERYMVREESLPQLKLDQPFTAIIGDESTGAIYYVARVVQPQGKERGLN